MEPTRIFEAAADEAGVSLDNVLGMQTWPVEVLMAAANGRIDLNEVARAELVCRGLGKDGRWVGFPRAAARWQ